MLDRDKEWRCSEEGLWKPFEGTVLRWEIKRSGYMLSGWDVWGSFAVA